MTNIQELSNSAKHIFVPVAVSSVSTLKSEYISECCRLANTAEAMIHLQSSRDFYYIFGPVTCILY